MASTMTERGFRARLIGAFLALVALSASSQEPAERESGISGARKTSEPAQEQQAAAKDCRNEVAEAFARLKTSGRAYRKETTATADRRTFHEIVAYYVWIGQRAWANWSPFPWGWSEEDPDPRFIRMKVGASDDFAAGPNVPRPAYKCLGRVQFAGAAYFGYRARAEKTIIVATFNGALSETRERELARAHEQMPQEWRTVFVDPGSRLPAYDLVAQQDQLGNPSSMVRFSYPNNINIEPPLWCRMGLCRSARR